MHYITLVKSAFIIPLISIGLASCAANNEQIGSVGGAVAGGVIGNQFGGGSGRVAATAVGAIAGGLIGANVGRQLDNNSRQAALNAEYNALEGGQPVSWQGSNGAYGNVVPQQTYQVGSQNCRRYSHTIYIDGTPQESTGTACRNPDGTWTPLS